MNDRDLPTPKLTLKLVNFRNFKKREIVFSSPTLLVGLNTVGKTNILEAIFLLATSNSFKKTKSFDLIYQGADFATINLSDLSSGQELELRLIKGQKDHQMVKKEVFVDQRKVSLTEFIGNFRSVIFSPESLHIIKGPPQERRSFLNIVLSQADREYLRALLRYRRVKRERNQLLFLIGEGRAEADELEFWNQELIKSGSRLVRDRIILINFLNRSISKIYQQISQTQELPRLSYQTNALSQPQPALATKKDRETKEKKERIKIENIEKGYCQVLKKSYQRDLRYQTTTRGPHRDEIVFYLGKRKMPATASQGEIRSLALSLKLGEKLFLGKQSGQPVNFLLDDPLSELDQDRGKELLKIIQKEQSITTALPEELTALSRIVRDFQLIELGGKLDNKKKTKEESRSKQ